MARRAHQEGTDRGWHFPRIGGDRRVRRRKGRAAVDGGQDNKRHQALRAAAAAAGTGVAEEGTDVKAEVDDDGGAFQDGAGRPVSSSGQSDMGFEVSFALASAFLTSFCTLCVGSGSGFRS